MPSSAKLHRTHIQVRFADTDAVGHINNASFAQYAELARLEFLRDLGAPLQSLILAHLTLDFRRQVRYGDDLYVITRVDRVGTTSVTLTHSAIANERLAAIMRSVVVHYDYEARKASKLPSEMRAKLEERIGVDAEAAAT